MRIVIGDNLFLMYNTTFVQPAIGFIIELKKRTDCTRQQLNL